MNNLTRKNLQHHCRTCLTYLRKDEQIDDLEVRYHLTETKNLASWIENSTSLPVLKTSADYPQFVCENCFGILRDFNKFNKLVWETANKLNSILLNPQKPLRNTMTEEKNTTSGQKCKTNDHIEMEIKLEEIECLNNTTSNEALNENLTPKLLSGLNEEIEIKMEFEATDTMLINTSFNKIHEKDENTVATTESLKFDTSGLHKKLKSPKDTNYIFKESAKHHDYKCVECDYSCAHVSTFKVHLRLVHDQELNTKPQKSITKTKNTPCEETVGNSNDLKKKHKCTSCESAFIKKSYLVKHIKFVHEQVRLFACQYCHLCFHTKYNLIIHERVHTGEKPFACGVCGRQFAHSSSLTAHKKTHKGKPIEENNLNPVSEQVQIESTKNTKAHDTDPEKMIQDEQQVSVDNIKKNIECDICHRSFINNSSANRHKKIVHEELRSFACQYCHRPFSREKDLKIHERMHTGEKPYACDICGHRFIRFDVMQKHRKVKHNIQLSQPNNRPKHKKRQCVICKKLFSRKYYMQHVAQVHKGIRRRAKYTCQYCPLKCTSNGELRKHERIHTGEKPFTCDICHRSFIAVSDMKNHRKSHFRVLSKNTQRASVKNIDKQDSDLKENASSGTEIKKEFENPETENSLKEETSNAVITDSEIKREPKRRKKSTKNIKEYKCVQCGSSFMEISTLSKHMANIHNQRMPSINSIEIIDNIEFPCCICQKTLKRRFALAKHLSEIHKESNPFPCRFCHLYFAKKVQLKSHERIHTGLRPFNCDICDRRFTRLGDKTKHQKIHHLEEKQIVVDTAVLESPAKDQTNIEEKKLVSNAVLLESPQKDLTTNQSTQAHHKDKNTLSLDPIKTEPIHQTVCTLEEQFVGNTALLDKTQKDAVINETAQDIFWKEKYIISEMQNEISEVAEIKIEETLKRSEVIIISDSSQDAIIEAGIAITNTNISDSFSSDNDTDIQKNIHKLDQKLKTTDVTYGSTVGETSKAFTQSNKTIKEHKFTYESLDSNFSDHMQQVHSKVVPISQGFECNHCNKNFIIFSNLNNHMRIAHKDLLEKGLYKSNFQSTKQNVPLSHNL